jgi:hypothetical protein
MISGGYLFFFGGRIKQVGNNLSEDDNDLLECVYRLKNVDDSLLTFDSHLM